MSYGALHSPLPGLTVSPNGCRACGMRGMGRPAGMFGLGDDVTFDTTSTDPTGDLIPPDAFAPAPTPIDFGAPILPSDSLLPLPNQLSPSLTSLYPQTVGTEFTSNGDGTYTNIQTGQSVPYSVAEQVSAATGASTGGAPTVDTTATGQNINIVDPTTSASSSINTNNLTTAAQALQAAGQLVNAAGQLTAQGQALLNGGNLYKAPPATGISGAMSSLTSWFSGSMSIGGIAVPNVVVVGLAIGIPMILGALGHAKLSSPRRRR